MTDPLADTPREVAFANLFSIAESLLEALRGLNQWGDHVHLSIATQADGCAYGEVFDGLRALLERLYPGGLAPEIHKVAVNNGSSLAEALDYLRSQLIETMNEITARFNAGGFEAVTEADSANIKRFLDHFPPSTPEGNVIASTYLPEAAEWQEEHDRGARQP